MVFFIIAENIPTTTLQSRLDKINNLYVHFVQKSNNIDRNTVKEYRGEFWIKRPNLFFWHITYPEENFLISDGMTLWFYTPIINQVTAYCIQSISDNFFWMLFFSNKTFWNNYNVYQQGDYFSLKPICDHVNIKECKIKITEHGIFEYFSVVDSYGECINYYLSKQNNDEIDISQFIFNIPKDVQLDDQRK